MADIISNFYSTDMVEETSEVVPTHEPFKPFNDLIQVTRVEEDNSTKNGFLIPEIYRQRSNRGSVVAVGPQVDGISPKDIILFGEYNSEELVIKGDNFLLIRQGDVRGVEKAL